jgi:hypothetical protein
VGEFLRPQSIPEAYRSLLARPLFFLRLLFFVPSSLRGEQ